MSSSSPLAPASVSYVSTSATPTLAPPLPARPVRLRLRWRSLPFAALWASAYVAVWCLWDTGVLGGALDLSGAVGFALCMVGATLCHELGHAVSALATGAGVAEVGFTPLGGRTWIDSDDVGAVVAISGPVGGLAYAALLWASGQRVAAMASAFIEASNLLPFWGRVDGARFLSRLVSPGVARRAKVVLVVALCALATVPGVPPAVVGVSWLLLVGAIAQAMAAVFDSTAAHARQPR